MHKTLVVYSGSRDTVILFGGCIIGRQGRDDKDQEFGWVGYIVLKEDIG